MTIAFPHRVLVSSAPNPEHCRRNRWTTFARVVYSKTFASSALRLAIHHTGRRDPDEMRSLLESVMAAEKEEKMKIGALILHLNHIRVFNMLSLNEYGTRLVLRFNFVLFYGPENEPEAAAEVQPNL